MSLTLVGYRSLYRRSLKLALDWAVHRNLWRGQAIYIRSLFEANRNITNPRQQRVCCPAPSLEAAARSGANVLPRPQPLTGAFRAGLVKRNREAPEYMETPRSLLPPNSTRRYIQAPSRRQYCWPGPQLISVLHRIQIREKPSSYSFGPYVAPYCCFC